MSGDVQRNVGERRVSYYEKGKLHREDGPAFVKEDGVYMTQKWCKRGKLHRTGNLPAETNWSCDKVVDVVWKENGKNRIRTVSERVISKITYWHNWNSKGIQRVHYATSAEQRNVKELGFQEDGSLKTIKWTKSNNVGEALELEFNVNGQLIRVRYDSSREDWDVLEPCEILFDKKGRVKQEVFMKQGKKHSLVGPAVIKYDKNNVIKDETYYVMGKFYGSIEEWEEAGRVFAREEKNQSSGVVMTDISL